MIRNTPLELVEGRLHTTGILFDLNDVFEDFVYAGIGEHVRPALSAGELWLHEERLDLDTRGAIRSKPDLSLWRASRCLFVGDAKYKRTVEGHASDLYQLLAYCTSTGLPEGLLVYGEAGADTVTHQVVRGGPRLVVDSIDIGAPLPQLQERLRAIAAHVLSLSGIAR
jgi:5-methylcytosine-specific restriction enzyme subunit McrC